MTIKREDASQWPPVLEDGTAVTLYMQDGSTRNAVESPSMSIDWSDVVGYELPVKPLHVGGLCENHEAALGDDIPATLLKDVQDATTLLEGYFFAPEVPKLIPLSIQAKERPDPQTWLDAGWTLHQLIEYGHFTTPNALHTDDDPNVATRARLVSPSAHDIIQAAAGHMQDRAATYDKPQGERSMSATVAAFNAISGHKLTETQGWLFMTLLKAVRSQQGAYRADNFEDGAAYFALMGECAGKLTNG